MLVKRGVTIKLRLFGNRTHKVTSLRRSHATPRNMLKLAVLQINRYAGFCRTNPAPAGERHFANERAARLSFPRRGIARAFDKDTFQNTNSGRRAPTPFPARSTVRASTRPKQQSVLTKTAQNTERERPQRSGTKSPPARHPCPQSPHTRKPRFSSYRANRYFAFTLVLCHAYYCLFCKKC